MEEFIEAWRALLDGRPLDSGTLFCVSFNTWRNLGAVLALLSIPGFFSRLFGQERIRTYGRSLSTHPVRRWAVRNVGATWRYLMNMLSSVFRALAVAGTKKDIIRAAYPHLREYSRTSFDAEENNEGTILHELSIPLSLFAMAPLTAWLSQTDYGVYVAETILKIIPLRFVALGILAAISFWLLHYFVVPICYLLISLLVLPSLIAFDWLCVWPVGMGLKHLRMPLWVESSSRFAMAVGLWLIVLAHG
jgi:hypothetical protein